MDGESPHPPFEFCVAVSGFKLLDPFCQSFFEPAYETRTLHVIGQTDVVVIGERSQQLAAVSANGVVVTHEGGHFVPSKTEWRRLFVGFMRRPGGTHAAPSSSASSQSSSYAGAVMNVL